MGTRAFAGAAVAIFAAAAMVQIGTALVSLLAEIVALAGMALICHGLLRRKDRMIAGLRATNAGLVEQNVELQHLLTGDKMARAPRR